MKDLFLALTGFLSLTIFSLNCFSAEVKIPTDTQLKIGIFKPALHSYVDLKDIEISINYWLQEVTRDLALNRTETLFYNNYEDLSVAFTKRDIDMFIAPPLSVVIHFDKNLIAEGFYSENEKNEGDALLLLARKGQHLSINSMKGKRLFLPSHDELAEIFLELITFKTYKKSYKEVFSQIESASKVNRAILSLFFGDSDYAVVYKSGFDVMAEMNQQIKLRIKIVRSYPVLSKNMTFMHKDYPYRKSIINRVKDFSRHPRGQQILTMYRIANVGIAKADVLGPFELLYKKYQSISNLALPIIKN